MGECSLNLKASGGIELRLEERGNKTCWEWREESRRQLPAEDETSGRVKGQFTWRRAEPNIERITSGITRQRAGSRGVANRSVR